MLVFRTVCSSLKPLREIYCQKSKESPPTLTFEILPPKNLAWYFADLLYFRMVLASYRRLQFSQRSTNKVGRLKSWAFSREAGHGSEFRRSLWSLRRPLRGAFAVLRSGFKFGTRKRHFRKRTGFDPCVFLIQEKGIDQILLPFSWLRKDRTDRILVFFLE